MEELKENIEVKKEKLQVSFKWFIRSLRELFKEVFSIYDEGTDIKGTTEDIKKDIEFKGHNVWILIFSIFIASIGLNLNSTAVIIGAMLISPLMGPIVGIGYSLGTNDLNTFAISFKNLLIAVVLSIATSFIYFKGISLLGFAEPQSELINRTSPTLLDVLIAIFGGLAGIISNSRKEKTNVIPGVAIATALMPPLCTAGFGLATGRMDFFFGAFYLFLLNSACITITTLIVVRMMHFPLVKWVDKSNRLKVKLGTTIILILLIIPSGYTFYGLIQKNIANRNIKQFIEQEVEPLKTASRSITTNFVYNYKGDTSAVELFVAGTALDVSLKDSLEALLPKYKLYRSEVLLYQNKNYTHRINEIAEKGNMIEAQVEELKNGNALLREQNDNLKEMNVKILQAKKDSVNISGLSQELKIWNIGLIDVAYAKAIKKNHDKAGIHTFILTWNKATKYKLKQRSNTSLARIKSWLEYKLKSKNIEVIVK